MDPGLVKEGIADEMDFMSKIEMFADASEEECWDVTGAAPISTRWVMVKKTLDDGEEIGRCRLVGRDFKGRDSEVREDLFAATPPLEALKLLLRTTAVKQKKGGERKLLFIDVKKAHLIPPCEEPVYVLLPSDFGNRRVVRLRRWLYGMRKAAHSWEAFYTQKLREIGFEAGLASPVLFHNKQTAFRLVVHGDDFIYSGGGPELKAIRRWMRTWCEIKDRGIMGSAEDDVKEREVLGRTIRWTMSGLEYFADRKHRQIIMKEFGLNDESKGAVSPMVKERGKEDEEEAELGGEDARWVRGLIARANYLAQDRLDIQFTAKELSRTMSRPRVGDLAKLKRLARYLVGAAEVVWRFPFTENEPKMINVYADSNWAACVLSRRSTSGGTVTVDGCTVKNFSATQSSIATSVGEAEYYAALRGAAEGLCVQALGRDLGLELEVWLWSDSTSARGIACRRGLSGRTRHLETKFLWLQEAVANKRLKWAKIGTEVNPADVLTKIRNVGGAARLIESVGGFLVRVQGGHPYTERGCWIGISLQSFPKGLRAIHSHNEQD